MENIICLNTSSLWDGINSYTIKPIDGTLIDRLVKKDDYLYYIEYSKYNYEWAYNYFKSSQTPNIGACSSIRKDDLYARNFDLTYNDRISFVVKTKSSDGRLSTIGTTLSYTLSKESYNSNKWYDEYKLLPFIIVDGINEEGVFCNINVVTADEDDRTTGTIPNIEKRGEVNMLMLPRYILDNFSTAEEALEYLTNYISIYAPTSTPEYEYHYMVGDKFNTYIVEFKNNEISWFTVGEEEDYPSIMTNFRVKDIDFLEDGHIDYESIEDYGTGLERYNLLIDNYPGISDKESLLNTLSNQLKYTNTYTIMNEDDRWLSEFVGMYTDGYRLKVIDIYTPELFEGIFNKANKLYNVRSRYADSPYYGTWQTVHTSVYDLAENTLTMRIQEDVDKTFTFQANFN